MQSTSLLVIVAALFASTIALAEPAIVTVNGKAAAHDKTVATDAASAMIRSAGWPLDDKPLTSKEGTAVADCFRRSEAASCVALAVKERGIHRVAVVSLEPQPTNQGGTTVVITERLVLASSDSVVTGQKFCDHCTDDTLAKLVSELTQELLDRTATGTGRTVLSVKSTPKGARYYVDGKLLGATDASIDIVPGTHTVMIEHDGFETARRTIEATDGNTADISVTLNPLKGPDQIVSDHPPGHDTPTAVDTPHRSRLLPGTLIGIGGAAIVAGVIVIALDQSPNADPNKDQPQRYYNTVVPGIAIAIGGAVVGGIGGYLWWKYSKSDATPSVAPVAGGAVVGFSTRF